MASQAEHFMARWFRNTPSLALLVLTGESGCGKTHVAKCVANYARHAAYGALEAGGWGKEARVPSSLFLDWPEATDGFKAGHYGVVEDAKEADLLILDDIGAEYDPSKNAANQLCCILSRRERRFTLVTSNLAPAAWTERFDFRIADRLMRNSVIVDLSGVPSYALR
jgi:DNA replication protein DnaC